MHDCPIGGIVRRTAGEQFGSHGTSQVNAAQATVNRLAGLRFSQVPDEQDATMFVLRDSGEAVHDRSCLVTAMCVHLSA